MANHRIYLSPPCIDLDEEVELLGSLRTGWLAPLGPTVDQFESDLKDYFNIDQLVALNSGTSALHLAVRLLGIQPGDYVLVGSLTFVAAANAVRYEHGIPIFIDSERDTWNLDPELLMDFLKSSPLKSRIKGLIVTHIYGKPAKMGQLISICEQYAIPIIEDAAESVGSTLSDKSLGTFGRFGVFSFNGNKILTTGGGGALICQNEMDAKRAKFLAEQAKDLATYYSHSEVGYNYRLSSPLAAIGIAQLKKLDGFIQRKKKISALYQEHLPTTLFEFPKPIAGENYWLTVVLMKSTSKGSPEQLIERLDEEEIEARRVWKPLHLQPLFRDTLFIGSGVSEDLFDRGICLPSGSGLSYSDQYRVIEAVLKAIKSL